MRSTNETRAKRAKKALETYPAGDAEYCVVDFLADLMHYCNQNKIDFDDSLRIARGHFEEEKKAC